MARCEICYLSFSHVWCQLQVLRIVDRSSDFAAGKGETLEVYGQNRRGLMYHELLLCVDRDFASVRKALRMTSS